MTRFLILIVVAAGLAVLSPDVRARIKPHTQQALNPVYTWSAKSRSAQISRMVAAEAANDRSLKSSVTFAQFLKRAFPSESGTLDPWGTPYYLKKEGSGVRVGSAGPDQEIGTADDILSPVVAMPKHFR